MKLKGLASLLFRRNAHFFAEEEKKGILNFVKSAWKQTFPEQQDQIRQKYQKVKQERRFTKEELEKIQADTPEYLKGALVSHAEQVQQEKEGFKISSLIPDSLKNKVKESPQYKEYEIFKQNLKEYASTRQGVIANAGTSVYSKIAQGSPESRSIELMRKYIKGFSIYDLQKQSTVIFKNAYHTFLSEKISDLQPMAHEQAYEYFSAHIKMNRTKKWKPKYTEMVFNYPAQFLRAKVGEKLIPTFEFNIKIMEIYCFIDNQGKIIEGGDDRVNESIYQFSLVYTGQHVEILGHPWTICEIKKLQEMKMLV